MSDVGQRPARSSLATRMKSDLCSSNEGAPSPLTHAWHTNHPGMCSASKIALGCGEANVPPYCLDKKCQCVARKLGLKQTWHTHTYTHTMHATSRRRQNLSSRPGCMACSTHLWFIIQHMAVATHHSLHGLYNLLGHIPCVLLAGGGRSRAGGPAVWRRQHSYRMSKHAPPPSVSHLPRPPPPRTAIPPQAARPAGRCPHSPFGLPPPTDHVHAHAAPGARDMCVGAACPALRQGVLPGARWQWY
eukprot:scaffold142347_cov21-Tisochrysis_lutea.AAC.2